MEEHVKEPEKTEGHKIHLGDEWQGYKPAAERIRNEVTAAEALFNISFMLLELTRRGITFVTRMGDAGLTKNDTPLTNEEKYYKDCIEIFYGPSLLKAAQVLEDYCREHPEEA